MTTTLVLTLEREAHIALLMEQDLHIRTANDFTETTADDDGFMLDASISVWDAFNDDEQNFFLGTNDTIEYVGVGICSGWMGCSSISHLYQHATGINDATPELGHELCAKCLDAFIYRAIFSSLRELDIRNVSSYGLQDLVSVKSIFPPATGEHEDCAKCNGFLAPKGVEVQSWYKTIQAFDADNVKVSVHQRCSYRCPGCNEYWMYGVASNQIGGDNYCQLCFDKYEANEEIIECFYGGHHTFDENLTYSSIRDEDMCQSCYDGYVECGDCGYEYHEDNGHTCEDDEESSNYSEYIHNYSYRPRPVFYPTKFEPYYLGIELEVEVCGDDSRNECAETVINALSDRVYLKEDGSLSNGFEIVTHPHTLFAYQNDIDWDFLKQLSKMGVRSWNRSSCGLHVHVSRTAFGWSTHASREAHLVRFNKLIYDNQRQVERLAGRKNNQFATFTDKGKIVPKVKFGSQSSGRYSAVNMEPESTIEVRVFKGSLRKERVLSGIEFVVAAVEYTRLLKIQHKSAPFAWGRFVHYVTANSDTYPNLFIIMNETFEKDNDPNGDN